MADKKVCVVVGVGPGMGLAVARRFGREGFEVALLARDVEKLKGLANELKNAGVTAQPYAVDVSNAGSIQQTFDQIKSEMGNPQVLVYNTAAIHPGPPSGVKIEDLLADFTVNVAGAMVAAQQVIPAMRSQKQGTILFTGGGLSLYPSQFASSLAIGKAGIRNLAYSLGEELETDGIQVGTVTICGTVKPNTHFDPDTIAEKYWELHKQPQGQREREIVYK